MDTMPLLKKWLAWLVGNGAQVVIGKDTSMGSGSSYNLLNTLIQHLKVL
jgi:hypothetical protein